jgi:hypothetical protein
MSITQLSANVIAYVRGGFYDVRGKPDYHVEKFDTKKSGNARRPARSTLYRHRGAGKQRVCDPCANNASVGACQSSDRVRPKTGTPDRWALNRYLLRVDSL